MPLSARHFVRRCLISSFLGLHACEGGEEEGEGARDPGCQQGHWGLTAQKHSLRGLLYALIDPGVPPQQRANYVCMARVCKTACTMPML
jgi:hypothetical protein